MKTEQEIIAKIVNMSKDIQYCEDKIHYAYLDEDMAATTNLLNKRKIELDMLTWLFS